MSLTQRGDTEARDALGSARHTDNAGPWLRPEMAGDSRFTGTELAQGPQRAERPRGPCGETVEGVDWDCAARGHGRLLPARPRPARLTCDAGPGDALHYGFHGGGWGECGSAALLPA